MKKIRISAVLLLVIFALTWLAGTASAAAQYTVTVSGGLYNEYYSSTSTSGQVTLPALTPSDDKYYFKGYHVAGQEGDHARVFTPDKDITLVAYYGIKGKVVPYTIHFLEYGTNRVLHDPITYHGNIGDKPVAPYVYIETYEPQAYNITGTLAASGNDWPIYYYPTGASPTATPVPANQNANAGANAGANANAGGNAAQPAPNEPQNNQPAPVQPQNPQPPANPQNNPAPTAAPVPQQIIDIDEPQAPLAGPTVSESPVTTAIPDDVLTASGQKEQQKKVGWIFAAIGAVSLLAILLALWYAFIFRPRKQEDEKED